jgi:hypothetical protein
MPNELAFSKSEQVDKKMDQGSFQSSPYHRIRVLVDCGAGSTASVEIMLALKEDGNVVGWLDHFVLAPGDSLQQVYQVPGTRILASANPQEPGEATINTWVWGYRDPAE